MKPLLGKSNRILFFEKYGNMGEHHALMRQFISRMIQSVPDTCFMYVHNTQSIIYYIFVFTVFVTHTHAHESWPTSDDELSSYTMLPRLLVPVRQFVHP